MKSLEILHQAVAGTVESSDIQIMLDSNKQNGIEIELTSDVEKQFGEQIRQVIIQTLASLGVENAKLQVVDKGALDCTIKARTIAAVHRAADVTKDIDWEGLEAWNV